MSPDISPGGPTSPIDPVVTGFLPLMQVIASIYKQETVLVYVYFPFSDAWLHVTAA